MTAGQHIPNEFENECEKHKACCCSDELKGIELVCETQEKDGHDNRDANGESNRPFEYDEKERSRGQVYVAMDVLVGYSVQTKHAYAEASGVEPSMLASAYDK